MAPEMVRKDQAIDGRSDMYSLGCLAYWLMTGRFVFSAQTPKDMLKAHLEEVPKPPSGLTTNRVDPELERITMRCLAKNVGDRPASAWALREELAQTGLAAPWSATGSGEWWARFDGNAA
ncbi:MAG: hypothetical protein DHS20C21_11130 [Gemmatimonadota bacterium]|nr:MAG: hypothetical protein DHS20C21_11130 [Gemmatimonadota bacterium]